MAKLGTTQDYLTSLPEPQRQIADGLLPLIEAVLPGAPARSGTAIRYGAWAPPQASLRSATSSPTPAT
jgi:hypothetical protein